MAFPTPFLNLLWRGVRRKVAYERPRVIGVAGSVGKTSTKEAIALVLGQSGRPVVKSHGNLGTDVGLPLTLFGFEDTPAGLSGWLKAALLALWPPRTRYATPPYYVLEYASDKPGDIAFLNERLAPDVAVISQVAPVHLAAFKDMDDLVKEELALAALIKPGGRRVLNADDAYQRGLIGEGGELVTFSLDGAAKQVRLTEQGLEVAVQGTAYQTRVFGRHQLYPVLAAIAVGLSEGMRPEDIQKGIAQYAVPPGRGRLIDGTDDRLVLDDSYNASPEAVKASLAMLDELGRAWKRRRVAVLGQMNELGAFAEQGHREVGEAAGPLVDFLLVVGQYGPMMLQAAQKAGLPEGAGRSFATPEDLFAALDGLFQPRDLILVKGSQNGVRLERLVKRLMRDPSKAAELLVRQDPYWQNRS